MTVMDLVASLPESQAQVYVLIPVQEGGVEATHRLEDIAMDQATRGCHNLEAAGPRYSGVLSRETRVDVTGKSILTDCDPRVLNCVVWKEEFPADDSGFWVLVRISAQRVQPSLGGDGVVVEEHKKVSGCDSGSVIARDCESAVHVVVDHPDVL